MSETESPQGPVDSLPLAIDEAGGQDEEILAQKVPREAWEGSAQDISQDLEKSKGAGALQISLLFCRLSVPKRLSHASPFVISVRPLSAPLLFSKS